MQTKFPLVCLDAEMGQLVQSFLSWILFLARKIEKGLVKLACIPKCRAPHEPPVGYVKLLVILGTLSNWCTKILNGFFFMNYLIFTRLI